MTALEKMALESLKKSIQSIMDRSHEKEHQRIEHERMFIHRDAKDAMSIIKAIEENNPNQ